MKPGDIVRVAKQPPKMIVHVEGEIGYIEEIRNLGDEDWAQIITLRLDGSVGGCGGVPVSCLEIEPNPQWHAAKAKHDVEIERLRQQGLARGRRYTETIQTLAQRYGISVEIVESIWKDMSKAEDREWRL